jgi:hypothetical protein
MDNMDKAKELIYHGRQTEMDIMPKVKYEDIPEDRREKWESHLATFDGAVSNDQEFEEWLATQVHVYWNDGEYEKYVKETPENQRESKQAFDYMLSHSLEYHRSEYEHITEFRKWRIDNLDPLIKELADMAAQAPQYDWQYLYALERQKLLCMRTYFSHSRISDSHGDFTGRFWMDICLKLLEYITDDGNGIPYEKIKKMNIRNVKGIVSKDVVFDYLQAPRKNNHYPDREFYGREIYVRKMERLYHHIRLYKTRDWWE